MKNDDQKPDTSSVIGLPESLTQTSLPDPTPDPFWDKKHPNPILGNVELVGDWRQPGENYPEPISTLLKNAGVDSIAKTIGKTLILGGNDRIDLFLKITGAVGYIKEGIVQFQIAPTVYPCGLGRQTHQPYHTHRQTITEVLLSDCWEVRGTKMMHDTHTPILHFGNFHSARIV